jgi:hypothetical protein
MNIYTGIGSRDITYQEAQDIKEISSKLSNAGWTVYSGNAQGADIAFQLGSQGKYVTWLPFPGFNYQRFKPEYNKMVCDLSEEAKKSVSKYHPAPDKLKSGHQLMMARNYHQVMGCPQKSLAPSKLVICCATPQGNTCRGGTSQAVRVAIDKGIPWVNIRLPNWRSELNEVLEKISLED